jgi:hypothetical protein
MKKPEERILERVQELRVGSGGSLEEFQAAVAEVVGKNGIPASLKLLKDAAKLDYA